MLTIWLAFGLVALLMIIAISITFLSLPTPRILYYMSSIPGPSGYWLFGNSIEMASLRQEDYLMWIVNKAKDYPRMMRLWILGKANVFLRDPDDVQVLLSSNVLISKGFEYHYLDRWLQEGLIHSSGQKWQTRRKMLTPSFHFKILEGALPVFNKHSRNLIKELESTNGESVYLMEYLSQCALHTICESAMGVNLSEDSNKSRKYMNALSRLSELIIQRLIQPWFARDWLYFKMPSGKEYEVVKNYLHEFTSMVVKERKHQYFKNREELDENEKSGKVRMAFLDTLLEIEARTPGTLSDKDIQEEVDSFMFAGHDTTSTFLNTYFALMGSYPKVQERVYEELVDVFGDDMDRDIGYSDLAKMKYMDCTIKESMRIMPTVPYISRGLQKDLDLAGGVKIPAGANVVISPLILHNHPKYWNDPDKYDPDRFLTEEARHPFAFIPFSAGARNCIGQKFALNELKVSIAFILRKLRVEAQTKHGDFMPSMKIIFSPTKNIFCSFHRRDKKVV